jgi:hypothetical protein
LVGPAEVYADCTICHNTDLRFVHGNKCSTCHPSPLDTLGTWTGGCQQGNCHTTKHEDASASHLTVENECTQCHVRGSLPTSSICANCHANFDPADSIPPDTTSDVQPSYVDQALINFSLTAGDKVGIGITFYRLDYGALQTGSSVLISTSGSHTLEFWSVDQAGNVESPSNTVNFLISTGTTPP